MRRSIAAVLAVFALAVAGAVTFVSPAGAQVGYPPGPCTVAVSTQGLGQVAVGQTVTFRLTPTCVFAAGAALTVTVNGVNIPGKVAAADGTVGVKIQFVSATQALVDDPVAVPNVCGENRIVASGRSNVLNGTVTHTGSYTTTCPTAGVVSGQLGRTGSDVAKWVGAGAALILAGAGGVLFARRRRLSPA